MKQYDDYSLKDLMFSLFAFSEFSRSQFLSIQILHLRDSTNTAV